MAFVHPTSLVSEATTLADDTSIGPMCVLEGPVTLGRGVRLIGQCWLRGPVTVADHTTLYPGVVLGMPPQHTVRDPNAPTLGVAIGARVTLREHVTIHAAMLDDGPTRIGDGSYLMSSAHVGHDCVVGERVIMATGAMLAGHCRVADLANISGAVTVHQFVRIGRGAMLSGGTGVSMDVPPWTMVVDRNTLGGLNLVGLRRNGVPREEITTVREAYRRAFRSGVPRLEMLGILDALAPRSPIVADLAEFVRTSTRGIAPGDGSPRPGMLRWLRHWRDGVLPADLATGIAAEDEA